MRRERESERETKGQLEMYFSDACRPMLSPRDGSHETNATVLRRGQDAPWKALTCRSCNYPLVRSGSIRLFAAKSDIHLECINDNHHHRRRRLSLHASYACHGGRRRTASERAMARGEETVINSDRTEREKDCTVANQSVRREKK